MTMAQMTWLDPLETPDVQTPDLPRQLTFDLDTPAPLRGADFVVSDTNNLAYQFVLAWPKWPQPIGLLYGANGVGKSHLAVLWAERSGAKTIAAHDLQLDDVPSLLSHGALIVEDIQCLADEAALFHAFNLALQGQATILATADRPALSLEFQTKDLVSRLRLAYGAEILAPNEDLLEAIFWKLVEDRQLTIAPNVAEFVLKRVDRDVATLETVLKVFDTHALELGRPITIPLARDCLAKL